MGNLLVVKQVKEEEEEEDEGVNLFPSTHKRDNVRKSSFSCGQSLGGDFPALHESTLSSIEWIIDHIFRLIVFVCVAIDFRMVDFNFRGWKGVCFVCFFLRLDFDRQQS